MLIAVHFKGYSNNEKENLRKQISFIATDLQDFSFPKLKWNRSSHLLVFKNG